MSNGSNTRRPQYVQPEHERLNVNPNPDRNAPNAPLGHHSLAPNRIANQRLSADSERQRVGRFIRAGGSPLVQPPRHPHQSDEPPIRRRGVPQAEPMPAHVGNEEHYWADDRSFDTEGGQKAPVDFIDNNEYVDVENAQIIDPLQQNNVASDDQAWVRAHHKAQQESELVSRPGDYLVYSCDSFLFQTRNEQSLREKLEDMLLNQEIDINKLSVYKQLSVDFGLILKD